MTTRTAAEALEKLIRLERNLEKKCHDLGYYNMIHVGLREFVEHAETFRAALAPPQEGEVEEWPEMWRAAWDKKPTHCACRFEWRPIPDWSGEPPKQLDECGFHKTQRESLLRATQSNGPASVQTPSRDGAESTAGLSQSAPAQEPVATLRVERAKNGRLRNWLDGEWQRNLPVGEYPLYTTPQIDDWKAAAKYSSDCHAAEAEREFSHPIATVVNNNQPHWTAIIETAPNVTLNVGTKLYLAPQSNNGRLTNAGDSIDREPVQTPGESPAQSAPAQEPVAQWWGVIDADNDVVIAFKHRHAANEHINVGLDKFMDDPEAFAEIKQWRLAPLYAATPPDEARKLLDEAILYVRGDAESGYEDAVQLHERIRAYLEKHK